jgi:hypothetical protein
MSNNDIIVLKIVLLDYFYSQSLDLIKSGNDYFMRLLIKRKSFCTQSNTSISIDNINSSEIIFTSKETKLESSLISLNNQELLM